jgi:hypothetical protein
MRQESNGGKLTPPLTAADFVVCGYRNRKEAEKVLALVRKLNPDIDPADFGFSEEPCPEQG